MKWLVLVVMLVLVPGVSADAPFPDTNVSELHDLFRHANIITGNHTTNATTGALIQEPDTHYFGDFMVIIVWVVVFGTLQNSFQTNAGIKALIVSSLFAFVWAVLLDVMNLIDGLMISLPLAILAITVVAERMFGTN